MGLRPPSRGLELCKDGEDYVMAVDTFQGLAPPASMLLDTFGAPGQSVCPPLSF